MHRIYILSTHTDGDFFVELFIDGKRDGAGFRCGSGKVIKYLLDSVGIINHLEYAQNFSERNYIAKHLRKLWK